jgi:uncharacterized protein (DUF362 family)/Pyruvate/2-oxoacid:ferredoxin oxidoreductase delta subunit
LLKRIHPIIKYHDFYIGVFIKEDQSNFIKGYSLMPDVIFKKATYDYERLKPIIFEMMDAISNGLIQKQRRVLIKPNLLSPAKPEKAILTHPLVVKAVAEFVISKGGHLQICDSPAMGSFDRVLKEGGFKTAFKDLDVEFQPFSETVQKDIGEPFGRIDIAREAVEADVVINLAKLKTHTQMLLTLGVKNFFGCIVGLKKPEWHMRSGVNRKMFARLLVQICQAVKPSITLVDGILAMEGQGPGKSGKPRNLGVLIGSSDAPSADWAICRMLGIDPDFLPTLKAARELDLLNESIRMTGDVIRVDHFELPVLGPLTFGPRLFRKLMRKHLVQRPVVDQNHCQLCGECWQYCPAEAITPYEKIIGFDYERCIRCYCCVEICPHGALEATETLPGKVIRRISRLNT